MSLKFTEVGKAEYSQKNIEESIKDIKYVEFTPQSLPLSQGEALKAIVKEFNLPLSLIKNMDIHNCIININNDVCGFYALQIVYNNGTLYLYIADNGCAVCVVASEFLVNITVN